MTLPRVVVDTNVLVSALLFGHGHLANIRKSWQNKQFLPLVNHDTANELIHVLSYPKFKLTAGESEKILADFLPFAEVVANHASALNLPELRDPDDVKFLELAVDGHADVLVSGDKDILAIQSNNFPIAIQTPSQFLAWLKAQPKK